MPKPISFYLLKFRGRERAHCLTSGQFFPHPPFFLCGLFSFMEGEEEVTVTEPSLGCAYRCIARSLEEGMQSFHTYSYFQPPLTADVDVKWIQDRLRPHKQFATSRVTSFHFFLPQTSHDRLKFRVSGHTGGSVVLKPLICIVTGYSVLQMSDKGSAYWQSDTLPPICL